MIITVLRVRMRSYCVSCIFRPLTRNSVRPVLSVFHSCSESLSCTSDFPGAESVADKQYNRREDDLRTLINIQSEVVHGFVVFMPTGLCVGCVPGPFLHIGGLSRLGELRESVRKGFH